MEPDQQQMNAALSNFNEQTIYKPDSMLEPEEANAMVQREARLQAEEARRSEVKEASGLMVQQVLETGTLEGGEQVVMASLFSELTGPRPMYRMRAADLLMECLGLKGKGRKGSKAGEDAVGRLKAVIERIVVAGDTTAERIEIEEG